MSNHENRFQQPPHLSPASQPELISLKLAHNLTLPKNLLREKDNVLAVRLTNTPETPSQLIGKVTLLAKKAAPRFIPMDATWKFVEGEPAAGWLESGFNDGTWSAAVAIQPSAASRS